MKNDELDQTHAEMPARLEANTRVALQDIRIHEHLSDDSTSFDATLLFDGQPIAVAYNRGQGEAVSFDVLTPDLSPQLTAAMVYMNRLVKPCGERNGQLVYPAYGLGDLVEELVGNYAGTRRAVYTPARQHV